ncbi:hypothetical protein FF38_01436 [Lucilia cuprina]|uniref:Uncharacterized protein n=1 Tax=Lucilia cuprina TaxID=7375 RepID=A0A0L0CAD0_LUCCU|nr:hypothetical protein FF38_01436 [Lucilia cuprina]
MLYLSTGYVIDRFLFQLWITQSKQETVQLNPLNYLKKFMESFISGILSRRSLEEGKMKESFDSFLANRNRYKDFGKVSKEIEIHRGDLPDLVNAFSQLPYIESNLLYFYFTYSSEKPLMCKIRICLIIVVLPDSAVPKSKIFTASRKFFCISLHLRSTSLEEAFKSSG